MAVDVKLDNNTNCDLKIGFILKELIKQGKIGAAYITAVPGASNAKEKNAEKSDLDKEVGVAGCDKDEVVAEGPDLRDIIELLEGLLEETESVSSLKCQIVYYVFESLIILNKVSDRIIVGKINELIFCKFLKKKDFDSPTLFCKFLARKFEGIYKKKLPPKPKLFLSDSFKENLRIFTFYFFFSVDNFICHLEKFGDDVKEDVKKRFLGAVRNFLKILQNIALMDEKLKTFSWFVQGLNCLKQLQSVQSFICALILAVKNEYPHNQEEVTLRGLFELIGVPINLYEGLESLRGVQQIYSFFQSHHVDSTLLNDYDKGLATLAQLILILSRRDQALMIIEKHGVFSKSDKDLSSTCSSLTLSLTKYKLRTATI